ncbi:MAG: hypothetical protein FWH32_08080 [Clostridiales bacterium]|nr:hypothetical protein [Clostridiales bacterium]
MKSRKTDREISRNIPSVIAGGLSSRSLATPRHSATADVIFHIFAVLIAILLPLSLIVLAAGITFRMPELATFAINMSDTLAELSLDAAMDEIDQSAIKNMFDSIFYPSIIGLALSLAFAVAVRLSGRPRLLKHALRASAFIYIAAAVFTFAMALYPPLREAAFAPSDGIYPLISAAMICLVSFIIYIVIYSVLRRFTKERETMFK